MNIAKIISEANQYFSNLKLVKDQIYKGELKVLDKSGAAIYYLDLNEKNVLDDFKTYQENLLANDFYGNSGSIQWNYYLLILRDKFDIANKKLIESDDKYARKFVFNEEEFVDYFKLLKPSEAPLTNVVAHWKEKLDSNELSFVYGEDTYSSCLTNFFSDTYAPTLQKKEIPNAIPRNIEPIIKHLDELKIEKAFRKHPNNYDSFKFGKVNLFYGKNGAGKTSLLEAIEGFLCGRVFRNRSKPIEDNSIFGSINYLSKMEGVKSSNLDIFRNRDLLWYSNPYTNRSKNGLCVSFNRYNFFNADAAYAFSNASTLPEIRESLLNLVMGAEYGYVIERVSGFRDRIKPHLNTFSEEFKIRKQKVKDWKIIRDSSEKNVSLEFTISTLTENSKYLNIDGIDKIPAIEDKNNEVRTIIENLSQLFPTSYSVSDIIKRKNDFLNKKNQYENLVAQYDRSKNIEQDLQTSLQRKQELILNFQFALKYFQNSHLLECDGLEVKTKSLQVKLQKIDYIKSQTLGISLQPINVELNLLEYSQIIQDKYITLQLSLDNCDNQISGILSKYDRLDQLVTEIKSLGKEYTSINGNAHQCPLCATSFDPHELTEKIKELDNINISNQLLSSLYNTKNELKAQLQLDSNVMSAIASIRTCIELILTDNKLIEKLAVKEAIELIKNFCSEEIILMGEIERLDSLRDLLRYSDCSEDELVFLKNYFIEAFQEDLISGPDKKTRLYELKTQIENDAKELNKKITDLENDKKQVANQIKAIFQMDFNEPLTRSHASELLENEMKALEVASNYCSRLSNILTVNPSEPLDKISYLSSLLAKSIDAYRAEVNKQGDIDRADKEIWEAENYLELNESIYLKLEKATKCLSEILEENTSDHLTTFFQENLRDVADIFRTVHYPHEFKGLFYDGELTLLDTDNVYRDLNEISTGQRAALAISVFISLNRRLKNGPNIILFDDPVANVDDLNLLSFFDFIRFFLLSENKQIFFATANSRIANLFKKKFDFLGEEDFRSWELIRKESENLTPA